MTQPTIYLTFDGDCRAALDFYKSVFGTDFTVFMTFADAPADLVVSADHRDKVMHATLPVGDGIIQGSDSLPGHGEAFSAGNNFSISLPMTDKALTERWFAALSQGGDVIMALQETFWGAYFGQCIDRFGIRWMLNCALTDRSDD